MENEKLVMFSFQNQYLQGIQAGIQSGHCWLEMAVKYKTFITVHRTSESSIFWEWAENHHTVSIKNGGDQTALEDIINLFQRADNPYPWQQWHEGEKALNGALTNVSIIVPEHVYGYVSKRSNPRLSQGEKPPQKLDGFDKQLYTLLTSCKNMI